MAAKGEKSKAIRGETDFGPSFAVNLMQHMVVPTFVLDADCNVLIWNKACERLTGVPAAEVIGTQEHWRAFYESPRPCLADLVAQGRTEEVDALYVAHDDPSGLVFGIHAENWCLMPCLGTELYLAIDAGPIYDADGRLLAVIETLRDMTDHRRAQTALEHEIYRPGDMVARYGGEEFAVILTATDTEGASKVARRILDRIAELAIPHSSGEIGHVTLSIGVATLLPQPDMTQEDLVSSADNALYQAKHAGRNRFVVDQVSPAAPGPAACRPQG